MDFKNSFIVGISTYLVVVRYWINMVLAKKMDLSTLPKLPIKTNDLYEEVDVHEGSVNYTEKVGSGYGWILVLIGLAILSIVFYIYVV